ncbi:sugar transferase [Planctomycetes bacterium K23_9]|uniref:UDP-glucose:undecaprenyl-phosphate glucose-1-phosphate transferase n=1 Tax=Stieleria marina TaxID=1930275 RepID=A0A517NNS9_9BACT|nr:UDP-glucose:undecaprenyl-phosphate glucose-1-phosphate transferase [Planctomycetes bacterium K23_9]
MSSTLQTSALSLDANRSFPFADFLSDQTSIYQRVKGVLDVTLALAGLIVLSPLLLLIMVAIKLTDFGPVFFVQTRIGEGGVPFSCLKFRSMRVHADREKEKLAAESHHSDSRSFKIARDPRITLVGRLIRKSSLDEMPQLWNVVRGEMSLVGPRPSCPQEVAYYTEEDWRRLAVKPGLTCIWQVCGRGDVPFDQQVKMDVEYVENRNLALDLKLIFLTIPAVLSAKGAY